MRANEGIRFWQRGRNKNSGMSNAEAVDFPTPPLEFVVAIIMIAYLHACLIARFRD